jgi:hypothetical protein
MKMPIPQSVRVRSGSILCTAVLAILLLAIAGFSLLTITDGLRQRTAVIKNEAAAMAAAEAGYEKAIFWMSQQSDMISALGDPQSSGSLDYDGSDCDYSVTMASFLGASPVYEVRSVGHSGRFERTVEVHIVQAIGGWSMGMCRVSTGGTTTTTVNFVDGEVIEMPVHINSYADPKDNTRDIFISGNPTFLRAVSMGESRYSSGGSDKYSGIMNVFDNGIYFNQPASRITDPTTVSKKITRFRDSTAAGYIYTPDGPHTVSNHQNAVQLEFYVDNSGIGKIRLTNNCSVRGFRQSSDSRTYDFCNTPAHPTEFDRYYIYGYHVRSKQANGNGDIKTIKVEDTYVQQSFGGVKSDPGGQIFVNGNVILGGDGQGLQNANLVKGRITIVATGNIWIANSIMMDGARDGAKPAATNTNALGLVAQGVVKVVDPGMSDYSYVDDQPVVNVAHDYVPIAIKDSGGSAKEWQRHLPDPMVVEAGITVGGGGWGAENVERGSYGGRKETSGTQDDLVLRGTLSEVCRGVVGLTGSDGYLKKYYLDERLMTGILPGDIWLRGKFVPLPAGWSDYRVSANP